MNVPFVSIIVPVYNVEPYLRQCLDSLINQTLREIEIICVDDGCTDGSPAILQEYAARDERIRIVTQVNKGVSAARNVGISNASAPYIIFCDPDDWHELNMCERMYHAINNEEQAAVGMCGIQFEYEYDVSQDRIMRDEKFFRVRHSGLVPLSGAMLLHNFTAAACNKIFRRSFLLEHHIQFPEGLRFEDLYFHNICVAHATHMVFLQDKLYHYRQRLGSLMFDERNKKPFVSIDRLRVAMLLWDYYKEHGLVNKWNGYIAKKWVQCLKICLSRERTKKARKCIADMARDFIDDNDKHTHALSDSARSEIISLLNNTLSSESIIQSVVNKLKKIIINMLPVAAWRRRLRKKFC